MRRWTMTSLALVAAAAVLCVAASSCQQQQATIPAWIDPTVLEVDKSAQSVKVNLGYLDGMHLGRPLYVAHNRRIVAYLTVRKVNEYSSEAVYHLIPGTSATPKVGDLVLRRAMDVGRPQELGLRVRRMVDVPYDVTDPDNTVSVKAGSHVFKVPRNTYDEWKRKYEAQKLSVGNTQNNP